MRREYKGININATANTHETIYNLLDADSNAVIADIPAGNGAFVLRLKDNGFKNIKAVDIQNFLEVDHDDFVVGDMTKELSMEDKSCDVVVSIDGIEHIDEQFDFIKEVHRVLKDDGDFILSTPNISSIKSRYKWLMTGHHHKYNAPLDEYNPSPFHHIGLLSFPELRYLLHTCGFQILQVSSNRIKAAHWIYALFIPFILLTTRRAYWKRARKYDRMKLYKEVYKTMFTKHVLFGETIVIKAKKRVG